MTNGAKVKTRKAKKKVIRKYAATSTKKIPAIIKTLKRNHKQKELQGIKYLKNG